MFHQVLVALQGMLFSVGSSDLGAFLLLFSHLAGVFGLQNILTLIKSLLALQAVIQCLPVSKEESANQILTFFVTFVVALLHQSNEIFARLSKKYIMPISV